MPDGEMDRLRFEELAERLHGYLKGRKVRFGEVARPQRLSHHNYIRYATTTGRLRIRWEGARQPVVCAESEPRNDYRAARHELARRHLHVFGPTTPVSFAPWPDLA